MASRAAGEWRIVEMDMWDADAIDLVGPAVIEIRQDGTGWFRFIAVEGHMDCRFVEREGRPAVEFSWAGNDEGDRVTGCGWAQTDPDGSLRGHIFIHDGDDSGFLAVAELVSE